MNKINKQTYIIKKKEVQFKNTYDSNLIDRVHSYLVTVLNEAQLPFHYLYYYWKMKDC